RSDPALLMPSRRASECGCSRTRPTEATATVRASVSWYDSSKGSGDGHYGTPPRIVSRRPRLIAVEIRHELLHAVQVAGEHHTRVRGLERRFATRVTHHAGERLRVERRACRDVVHERDVVRGNRAPMQPKK